MDNTSENGERSDSNSGNGMVTSDRELGSSTPEEENLNHLTDAELVRQLNELEKQGKGGERWRKLYEERRRRRDQRVFEKQEKRIAELEADKQRLRHQKKQVEDRNRELKRRLEAFETYEPDEETHSQLLLELARGEAELFRDERGQPYATFRVSDEEAERYVTARLKDAAFMDWWRHRFYDLKAKPPSHQALQDAKNQLRARARYEGETKRVHIRVAEHENEIYIDLADKTWRAVKVTPRGWSIVQNPPVKFRRPDGMKPLPEPVRGGSMDLLRKHVNVRSDEDFALLCAWLVQAFNPNGPYPVLPIVGVHDSGKSRTQKVLRALVDPSHVPTRTAPKTERDLVIAAENGWLLSFDNLSGVQPWLSDGLCRLSTGGGFGTRKLYEDREEEIFYAERPIVLNGIEDLTTRPDLADRSVVLRLDSIPDSERRTEKQMKFALERDRSRLFGAILDALETALRRRDSVGLDSLPRMADFALWAKAAEPAFPVEKGTFMAAYTQNRSEANETALEADPVAAAVRRLLEGEEDGRWEGQMDELRKDLLEHLPDPERPPEGFPSSHQALTADLRRALPVLREVGIEKIENEKKRDRTFQLVLNKKLNDKKMLS